MGLPLGELVGPAVANVGFEVGELVGFWVVGLPLGELVGPIVLTVGFEVGELVGF